MPGRCRWSQLVALDLYCHLLIYISHIKSGRNGRFFVFLDVDC